METLARPIQQNGGGVWKQRWNAFWHPLDAEKQSYLQQRWRELPEELKTPNQMAGRHLTHCAFTLGASFCSFHCTHCYLPKEANRIPIPSLDDMREQIAANRRFQGPGAGLQITGGDVVDAYFRADRFDELIEIVRMTYAAGLIPMLFTHGQTLIENPNLLERLAVEGGLRQVAVHIDMTQAGRHGYPINAIKSEADLHPVREAFLQLALETRRKTGLRVEFAHNCTVTRKNLDGVREILQWMLADPIRCDVWRIVSFQPEANTGRTIHQQAPITPDDVWQKICEGVGHAMRKDVTIAGHPECNSYGPVLVDKKTGAHCPAFPQNSDLGPVIGKIFEKVGGISLVSDDAGTAPYRLAGIVLQNLPLIFSLGSPLLRWYRGLSLEIRRALLQGRVLSLNTGIHNFMDAAKVANAENDPETQCRLDSCSFKGAVRDEDGEWQAVPMCRMNESRWRSVYAARAANPELRKLRQAAELEVAS